MHIKAFRETSIKFTPYLEKKNENAAVGLVVLFITSSQGERVLWKDITKIIEMIGNIDLCNQ